MQYQGIESKINPEKERDAIMEFLDRHWNIKVKSKKSVTEAIDYILQAGIKYGIALQEKELEEGVEFYNRFVDMVNTNGENLEKIEFKRTTSDEDTAGYFPVQAGLVESALKKEWNISAKPKDYKAFKQTYDADDFADMDEKLEFKGTELHHRIGCCSLSFTDCLKKGNVFYSEENQGRPPLTELVGAVYRQGMNIGIQVVEQWGGNKNEIMKKGIKLVSPD